MPKVSIVTPCHNAGAYLAELIASVQRQTLRDWEQIIVDDGSTDDSAATAARLAAVDSRIRLVRQAQKGVCAARNEGFRHACANSPYIYFLDADDLLQPTMLEEMTCYLDAHPEVGIVSCDYAMIDEKGLSIQKRTAHRYVPTRFWVRTLRDDEPNTPFVSVYAWAPVMESVSIIRRSAYVQSGGWDESLGQCGEGTDLTLALSLSAQVHFYPRELYSYRQHDKQSSCSNRERRHDQMRKIIAKWDRRECLTGQDRAIISRARAFFVHRLYATRLIDEIATTPTLLGKCTLAVKALWHYALSFRRYTPEDMGPSCRKSF